MGADLHPGILTLHVPGSPHTLLAAAGLVKAPKGRVELRRKFWSDERLEQAPNLAPRLLVIANLIATRDPRCLNAARQLREGWKWST